MRRVYLDNASTTKVDEEVLNAILPYLKEEYGNPSSIYSIGRNAKKAIEDAREKIAKVLNAEPTEIFFTGSGSESCNMAVRGIANSYKDRGNHIITSKIEHPAVLETCKALEKDGFQITYIPVNEEGIIDLDGLREAITNETILITIMYANNEIGTLQPIKEIGEIARKHNIFFHTDAVQAFGTIKIDVKGLGIDLLSLSGHKLYAPKGVGALYLRKGIKLKKVLTGGHQERDKRAGTENVTGIVGLGKATELAYENIESTNKKIQELREYYISEVVKRIPHIKVNGDLEKRLPGNSNISFRYIEGESLLLNLDIKGICASSGSACTSGSLDPSHVLLALGLSHEIAHGSLRVTIGKDNTKEDIDYLLDNLEEVVQRLRNMSPLYNG
ncbi:MAG: cysteine desulfurase NifS [Oscillospiraceae bacterium]|nr:cysteine desulfurase NifS [Oscillospiraceae bacterium]